MWRGSFAVPNGIGNFGCDHDHNGADLNILIRPSYFLARFSQQALYQCIGGPEEHKGEG